MEPPTDNETAETAPRLLVETLLASKLSRPLVRAGSIPRTRLITGLERGAACPLTVVAAPAGYGKTTAVSQWLESSGRAGGAAWVTLDELDDQPTRLWTLVATGLESIGLPIARDTASYVSAHQHDIEGRVLTPIAAAMTAGGVTLVIDDFDRVRSAGTAAQFDFLVSHLGPDAHLVVISRSDPALRLGRRRAAGQVIELRAKDLAFTADETATLLTSEGLVLPATTVRGLVRRTEGWPAGIYLAALTAVASTDPDAFLHDFAGNHRYVVDYLVEEVLSRQPAKLRAFILDVSILDRFCAPLCEELAGQRGLTAAILRTLQDTNMFLVPLGGDPPWFRFHNLFRTVARSLLETEDPDRALLLHRRAAHWLEANGQVGPAIEHALRAGLVGDAARMAQVHWMAYYDTGLAHEPARWLRAVADAGGDDLPSSVVASAWMAAVTGVQTELDRRLSQLETLTSSSPLPDGAHSIDSVIAMLRGQFGYHGPGPMLRHAKRAAELETGGTPWHALANSAYGHALYVVGSLHHAVTVLARAAYDVTGPAVVRIQAYALEALAYLELGQPDRARAAAERSMALVIERSLQDVPAASLAFTAVGASQAVAGDVAQAMATLQSGLVLRRQKPGLSPWPLVHHLLTMSRVSAMTDDLALARTLLDEATDIMHPFDEGMAAMRGRVEALRAMVRASRHQALAQEPLSVRELEFLAELGSGKSLNEIAAKLFISHNTAKSHARRVYRKLGAGSRAEAVRIAHEQGLP